MENAGFALGDIISITIDNKTYGIPYYDGYYTRSGELLLVAYPSHQTLCFTASNTRLPEELRGLEGHAVVVKMKEKGGCLDVQKALSLKYSNERSDYPTLTDAQFANARAVSAGKIASGVLHRCSTPFTDATKRLMHYASISDEAQLQNIDYAKAFSNYLISHGLSQQQLDALIQTLTIGFHP